MTTNYEAPEYKHLIESLPAIPWRLDWRTKCFTYIGPQIEQLLGWPRESWRSAHNFADRIHPLDRERVLELYLTQSFVTSDFETEYSALRVDGEFVLIRDVVHVARNADGDIESLMGFMIAAKITRAKPGSGRQSYEL